MLEVSFPVTVPEPGHRLFLFQSPLKRTSPPRIAQHVAVCHGISWEPWLLMFSPDVEQHAHPRRRP